MTAFVRLRGVGLELPFESQGQVGETAHGLLSTFSATRRLHATVLSGISFNAAEGDRVGIMGLNGAGKTTLLRVLNGALLPTHGSVQAQGSVQSLLSTTLGFNEYASLTENIILRGTAMGLRYRQVDAALEGILDFAGLGDRASHRLYTLSAGQRMRLGFAISTCVQPDILLMDEWIGAGDATFIQRAKDRMMSRFHGSRIVVLASHSTQLLRSMCNKALVLDRGRMRFYGDIKGGIEAYQEIVSGANADVRQSLASSDPLLFGNSVGLVERIQKAPNGLHVAGWAVGDKGSEVSVLCVELDGRKQLIAQFQKLDRDDVRHHLAKRSGNFGFSFTLPSADIGDPTTLPSRLRVSAGSSETRLGAPLPLAASGIFEIH